MINRTWIDKEGPEEVVIPEQRLMVCTFCKYYHFGLLKSGMNPIYRQNCEHESAPRVSFLSTGNLDRDGGVTKTPDWCPFLKKKIRLRVKPDLRGLYPSYSVYFENKFVGSFMPTFKVFWKSPNLLKFIERHNLEKK